MEIKQENLCLLAVEHARSINNFVDCDVIQEALEQVRNATDPVQALEALGYLDVAIQYRKPGAKLVAQYKKEFQDTMTV